jgi:hypothetical protein
MIKYIKTTSRRGLPLSGNSVIVHPITSFNKITQLCRRLWNFHPMQFMNSELKKATALLRSKLKKMKSDI